MSLESTSHDTNEADASVMPESREAKKEHELTRVQEDSLPLTALHLQGMEGSVDRTIHAVPNTWNENDGVIVWLDRNGRTYATPSSDRTREVMFEHLAKDEQIGVPHLNAKEVWGDKAEEGGNNDFRQWERLCARVSDVH